MSGAGAGQAAAAPGLRARLAPVVNLRAASLTEGIRAALAVAVILAANLWLDWPPLAEAALGALLTCLCDSGGPIRRRIPSVLTFAVLGGALTGVMGLARARGLPVAVPLACALLFCTAFVRVYGLAAQQVGNLLAVTLVLAVDRPMVPRAALLLGGLFAAGGLWAALLTMVIWRVYPFLPARRAVADVYFALAALCGDLAALLDGRPSPEVWDAHARLHRRTVRDLIEVARAAVLDAARARGATARAGQSMIRLEVADQAFGLLIALSDLAEQDLPEQDLAEQSGDAAASHALLDRLRPLLLLLGQEIVADSARLLPAIDAALADVATQAAELPDTDPLHRVADGIVERLRVAATLAAPANFYPASTLAGEPLPWRARLLGPLRANWNWQSLALRHAARLATVAAPAFAITIAWYGPFEHWLTITMLLTMQPYFALTFTRALERIGGTVLGGLIAAAIGFVCRTQQAIAIAMFPLLSVALALRQVNYGLYILALTPMIVLLVEYVEPGMSEWTVAGLRAGYTVAGGLLAVAGCYVLWPSWEPMRLREEVSRAIEAHAAYADAALSAAMGHGEAALDPARRAAGMASNNVEASLSRALLEPGQLSGERLEAALVIDAALRRMAGRLAAMRIDPALGAALPAATWAAWRGWIVTSARGLSAGNAPPGPRPPVDATGPAGQALVRIARQVELMSGALARLA